LEPVGVIKSWMAEHVFVTIGMVATLAVLMTMLVLLIASAHQRHLWLWLFRIVTAAGVALGATAITLGAGAAGTSLLEVGIGFVIVSLGGYFAGARLARAHEVEWINARSEHEKLKAEHAKLKEHGSSIKLVVDPAALK